MFCLQIAKFVHGVHAASLNAASLHDRIEDRIFFMGQGEVP